MATGKARGKVLWFNDSKGYGEILGEDGNKYFAHYAHIDSEQKFKSLKEGASVHFIPGDLPDMLIHMEYAAAATRIKARA